MRHKSEARVSMRTATVWVCCVFGICCCTCPDRGTFSGQHVELFVNVGFLDRLPNVWDPLGARRLLLFPMRMGFRTVQIVNSKEREFFDGVTAPEDLSSFYRALVETDGHVSRAELWGGKKLHLIYFFDDQGRVVRSQNMNGEVREYKFERNGEDQIEEDLQRRNGVTTHASREVYDRDGWRKESWWRDSDGVEMREVYDYQKGVFRTYDSGGNVIEERRPRTPRNNAMALLSIDWENAKMWPVLKFVPVGQRVGAK